MNFVHFTAEDIAHVAHLFRVKSDPKDLPILLGLLGGVKRRATSRAKIKFCSSMRFEDISLTAMKHLMQKMFGSAVSNSDLMAWATPGRKADDRVDTEKMLKDISLSEIEQAAAMMRTLHAEWAQVKVQAGKLAAPPKRKGKGKKTVKK
jgi:hypothetical protein